MQLWSAVRPTQNATGVNQCTSLNGIISLYRYKIYLYIYISIYLYLYRYIYLYRAQLPNGSRMRCHEVVKAHNYQRCEPAIIAFLFVFVIVSCYWLVYSDFILRILNPNLRRPHRRAVDARQTVPLAPIRSVAPLCLCFERSRSTNIVDIGDHNVIHVVL